MRDLKTFRGSLLGGAAGDALGYEIEFKRESQIFSRYGERGITEYALHNGKALISDDTQMLLFTATGLLTASARSRQTGGEAAYTAAIRDSYLDWLKTQEYRFPLSEGPRRSWLANVPDLFSSRAPGNTCMISLEQGGRGTIEKPINNSKGCGGIMRVAPIGLYFSDSGLSTEQVARLGAEAAAITHGHILGWMPSAALVQIVHEISQNHEPVYNAVMKTLYTQDEMWPDTQEKEYCLECMRTAVDLAGMDKNDLDAIHKLGEGWVAEETLAIAVYCALKYADDFDSALIASVNHKGDSDSTGAVTGNIVGAALGMDGIPEKYKTNLELSDVILEIADDLWKDQPGPEQDPAGMDPVWISKYVQMDYRK